MKTNNSIAWHDNDASEPPVSFRTLATRPAYSDLYRPSECCGTNGNVATRIPASHGKPLDASVNRNMMDQILSCNTNVTCALSLEISL